MPDSESHDWLDAELRNVPLPANLLARLSASGPRQAPSDERLDNALRAVEVPIDLESRLRRIARPRYRPTPAWQRMALAASVFVVLGLGVTGYVALIGGAVGTSSRQAAQAPTPPAQRPAAPSTPTTVASLPTDPAKIVARDTDQEEFSTTSPQAAIASNDAPSKRPAATATPAPKSPVQQLSKLGTTVAETVDTGRRQQAALGAGGSLDRLPELEAVDSVVSRRGVAPPKVSGYDLLFQLKHGEHPFVSPSTNPDLMSTRLPFTWSTLGYDLARRAVAAGQSPAADETRVEDFIAAQNYLLPPAPSNGLALHMAGAPSPLGKKGQYLMQLVVQSATRFARPHKPTRLIVAVEMSWPMHSGGRREATQRALANLAEHLAETDRVTVIGFADDAHVLARDVSGRELGELLTSDKWQWSGGATDYVEAIESTVEAVRAAQNATRSRVIFLVANRKRFGQAVATSKQALAELGHLDAPWQALCVAPAAQDEQRDDKGKDKDTDKPIAGTTVLVASSAAIEDRLADVLTDRPGTVANDVTLRLSFNPKVVTGYRLLGHEAVTLTGGASDPLVVDLRADHAVAGLYELWLKPGNDDVVATAELDWRDPAGGQARRVARPLRRSQVEASFSQSPPWFQQGVVAAKAAESLRGSFYAESPKPLARLLELADQVDPRVARERTFQDLVTTVRQAEKLR